MPTAATPHESIVTYLQNSATLMPQIVIGQAASPFYQEVPEPKPAFPYIWYDIPEGPWMETFENAGHDEFAPVFRVYMREIDIQASASPYIATSPFYVMDLIATLPRTLDGANFQCVRFRRQSWVLKKDADRGPDTGRVWIAESRYSMWIVT